MTRKVIKRLRDLEKKIQPKDEPKIIIVWDRDPEPAKPGETVIEWDDDDDEED